MFFGNAGNTQNTSKKLKQGTKGENIVTEINVSLEDAFLGVSKTLGFKTVSGKMKCYKIDIPAGIQNNEKLRLVGQGKKSINGGKNGDLLLKINIQDTDKFKLEGKNIKTDLLLTPWEAALSKKIKIETLDGEATVFIPAGTQSGENIVLKGMGYPDIAKERGDLILQTKIVIPKQLNDKQKSYFKNMEEIMNFNPRIEQ